MGVTAGRPRARLRRYVLPSLLAVLLLPATHAHAGGALPPTSLDAGTEGVVEHGGGYRFTASPLATKTVLTRSQTQGGRVLRASIIEGRWGVPVVADDGTPGGLSANSSTLVLTRVADAHPRRRTSFAVVDTERMAVRDSVHLAGHWRVDALSPDGRWLYLMQQRDWRCCSLRTYDLANHRLLEHEAPMRGSPVTRASGPGGRWHYTLYAVAPRPFIHAHDTARRSSHALALPRRLTAHRRLWALRLEVRRGRVVVRHGDQIVASAARRPRRASVGGGPPWLAVAVATASLLLAAVGTRRAQVVSRRSRELRKPYSR
jgi:hypothetical protein